MRRSSRTCARSGKTVGVISVDPSSPFSHGALLGDRIRLTEHFTDPDVFIRSMASRGHLGGLAGATADAVSLMDAFGKDVVLSRRSASGQSEIEIAEVADTTLVALQPGSGDSVQVLKAGVLEIADVFVVNKSDHPMALQLQREIRSMMEMLNFDGWVPKLVSTQALEGKGIDTLWDAIVAHDAWLRESGAIRDKRRAAFAHRVRPARARHARAAASKTAIAELGDDLDPYAAADAVLRAVRRTRRRQRGGQRARAQLHARNGERPVTSKEAACESSGRIRSCRPPIAPW